MNRTHFPRPRSSSIPAELELHVGGVHICGTSVAARATAFALPSLGVVFDLGRLTSTLSEQGLVFLSHGHLDHLSGILAYLNLRTRFFPDSPTELIAPIDVATGLLQALPVMPGMESVKKRMDLNSVIRGVKADDEVVTAFGSVTSFALDHRVPCLGWTLRRSGESRPVLVFAADSTIAPFRQNPELLDAQVAIVECSFVAPNRRVAANLSKHCHVLDWIELASEMTCDHLVLAHLPALPGEELTTHLQPLASAFKGQLVAWATPE